jgi:hypothetical protein
MFDPHVDVLGNAVGLQHAPERIDLQPGRLFLGRWRWPLHRNARRVFDARRQ